MNTTLTVDVTRKLFRAVGSALLAALWALFAYRHIRGYMSSGEVALLLFCVSESLQATLFLVRRAPLSVSAHPGDWLVALCGTFAPFLLVPVGESSPVGSMLVALGVALQIMGLLSLNRSFGIVPAKRRIKTGGMYRFVRHPMYASYFILLAGYLLGNATVWNASVCAFTLGCMVARMLREEAHLQLDPVYSAYMSRVRYRVLPFIF